MSSTPVQPDGSIRPAGFFLLRTPLLPLATVAEWLDRGDPSTAISFDDEVHAPREKCLREPLRQLVRRPEIREALYVASPSLHASLDDWFRDAECHGGAKIEAALVRYVMRMASRSTPFGLFAGCSTGMIGNETRLELGPIERYRRCTRLDMDYLFALTRAVVETPELRTRLRYFSNPTLYRFGECWRYVETRLSGKARSYHLVAVEETRYLLTALQAATHGASHHELSTAVAKLGANEGVLEIEALEYIDELITAQLLVSEIAPPVTGDRADRTLLNQFRQVPACSVTAVQLGEAVEALDHMDRCGLGRSAADYDVAARLLPHVAQPRNPSHLFQVDMFKPVVTATLGRAVTDEVLRTVEALRRISYRPAKSALTTFRTSFVERYGEREIRLLEALDEEIGIGFDVAPSSGAHAALLAGLAFPSGDEAQLVDARALSSFPLVEKALSQRLHEIILTDADFRRMTQPDAPPLPDAFQAAIVLSAASSADVNRGDFQVVFKWAMGPSGARVLGRFCDADAVLADWTRQHLRREEAGHPDCVFAEIAHLPEGRVGNVLCRPVLRDYEISFMGRSGAPPDRQIPVSDLWVAVRDGRIVLTSKRLKREVVPRLSSAHNFINGRNLGVYRFLCSLQSDGVAPSVAWTWGPFSQSQFLPRVVYGRSVLSRATWRLSSTDLQPLRTVRRGELFDAVQRLAASRVLPRWVELVEGDNELLVDLHNPLSVDTFGRLVKRQRSVTLVEMFPTADQLCVSGPEGLFTHEMIIPFERTTIAHPQRARQSVGAQDTSQTVEHRFSPGSEWLFVKLYTGNATGDRILRNVVTPTVRRLMRAGTADRWFFLRYGDPDWHIRLRLHGEPTELLTKGWTALSEALEPALAAGSVWRIQLDTYEREITRYGGPEAIGLAERIFHFDSEAVTGILEWLDDYADSEARGLAALCGLDALLDAFGFDFAEKRRVVAMARQAAGDEFGVDKTGLKRMLARKYRQERRVIENALSGSSANDTMAGVWPLLQRRSSEIAPLVARLRELDQRGMLACPLERLALSFMHMFANRLLVNRPRAQELTLYDFLSCAYKSQAARHSQTIAVV